MCGVALMGRRKDCYTDEEKDEILAYVLVQVSTGRFVSRVFREDQTTDNGIKLPAAWTFWRWMLEDESGELDAKLLRAREKGIEALLDETIDIADQATLDTIRGEEGEERPNTEWLQRSKLRIETRIKLAQMMKPKTYGPKLDVTSGGEKLGLAEEIEQHRRYMIENMPKLPAPGEE
jgi:hypothetical protein